jgi:hypothetical protein
VDVILKRLKWVKTYANDPMESIVIILENWIIVSKFICDFYNSKKNLN